MKILMMVWDCFSKADMIDAYHELGYEVVEYPFTFKNRIDQELEEAICSFLAQDSYSYVFSFNYFPVISNACQKLNIRYISWIYDSPYVMLYSCTVIHPCNIIFVFDKTMYQEFHKGGIPTIHYLPLAANTKHLDSLTDFSVLQDDNRPLGEVSFVGSLYVEKLGLYDKMYPNLHPYTQGYLEGVLNAQKQVYGKGFMDDTITSEILDDMWRAMPIEQNISGIESKEYVYANYVLCRKLTVQERIEYLYRASIHHKVDLYTPSTNFNLPNICNHGTIDFYHIAPYVYKASLINLNITLRSIKSGIPLRAFEIMGSGGFLLTNYQEDFLDCFVPGEDFVYFDSGRNLEEQIDYYLRHPDERNAIAENGHRKVQEKHTFLHRIKEMESYL